MEAAQREGMDPDQIDECTNPVADNFGSMSQEKLMFVNALPAEQKQSRIEHLRTMEGRTVPSGPYPHQLKMVIGCKFILLMTDTI